MVFPIADTRGQGSIDTHLAVRLLGAAIGAAGFFLLAVGRTILGTACVGIGSLLIAVGE